MTRSLFRSLAPSLLLLALASPAILAGCKSEHTTVINQPEPSDYRQWEQATHRPHVDLDKRSPDDQKEYRDWHAANDHH